MKILSFRSSPFFFVTFFSLVLSCLSFAQESSPKRISFEKGRTTAIVKAILRAGKTDSYLLRAGKNQQMTVHLAGKAASNGKMRVDIFDPQGNPLTTEEMRWKDWDLSLLATGDYRVEVSGSMNAPYTLEITIR